MLTRNTIKYIQSLKQKKFRQMYNNFVVEGVKMATEIIQNPIFEVKGIYALESWITENSTWLNSFQSKLHIASKKDLERISGLKTPNQVLVVCQIPRYKLDLPTINNSLTLYLDNIQNPGNLGSILRIADWFGWPFIFCSENTVEVFNPKVIQASMGAFLRVQTITIDFDSLVEQLPTLPTFATVLDGENVFQIPSPKKGILIIGNEGAGVSDHIIEKANYKISIPKGREGQAESLNAAVATGIFCAAFEQ